MVNKTKKKITNLSYQNVKIFISIKTKQFQYTLSSLLVKNSNLSCWRIDENSLGINS